MISKLKSDSNIQDSLLADYENGSSVNALKRKYKVDKKVIKDFLLSKGINFRDAVQSRLVQVSRCQGSCVNKRNCKTCRAEYALKYNYGINRETYDQLLQRQNGVCAICGKTNGHKNLAVDHNHKDGTIRGLLCDRCNTSIGKFEDDPDLLRSAIRYLEDTSVS